MRTGLSSVLQLPQLVAHDSVVDFEAIHFILQLFAFAGLERQILS